MYSVLVVVCLFLWGDMGFSNDAPRPNFLLLVADDMGWGDLGINLPHLPSNTPHLDTLAKNGLR